MQWRSRGTTVTGTVQREITSDTEAAGRTVRASKDEPQYQVRSDKTGADAVHKASAHSKSGSRQGNRTVWGRRAILRSKRAEPQLSDDDYAHMRKVVGYAKRHLAQRPRGDVSDSAWRYSLMNWGHDPTRTWRLTASSPPVSSL